MALKYVDEIELTGKRVLARFDFNVPIENGTILDSTRIDEALESIRYMIDGGVDKLVLMGHLGRPNGKFDSALSLEPVADYLAGVLDEEVLLTESCLDKGIKTFLNLNQAQPRIILLQNLRFHPQEMVDDRSFAKALASYGDIYVNDAFGATHRKHASIYQINAFFKNKAVGGPLLKREISALQKLLDKPDFPFVIALGGVKVSDKIKVIEQLLPRSSNLIIGGAMAYPFLKVKGHRVGDSLCSDQDLNLARKIFANFGDSKIILPVDHMVAPADSTYQTAENTPGVDIPTGKRGLDIGGQTLKLFHDQLKDAKSVLWNGPMGLFENDLFAKGTLGMAQILATLENAFSVVGGGDTVFALKKASVSDKISHVSTGGGATLEFLEEGTLPGIEALKFGIE